MDSFVLRFQHYQRDIVRGVEGYIVTGSKQVEIGDFFDPLSFNLLYFFMSVIDLNWLTGLSFILHSFFIRYEIV